MEFVFAFFHAETGEEDAEIVESSFMIFILRGYGERRKVLTKRCDYATLYHMAIQKFVWEEFPVGPQGPVSGLHVTINKKGEILIGAKTFEKFGRPEQVLLSFERRYDLIALEPVTEHATNAFPLVQKSNGRHRVIRANLFCRHHGINFAGTIAFNTPEINEKGVLILNLRAIRGVSKPRRRKG